MATYTLNYKESEHDSGVSIEIDASNDAEAIDAVNTQVEQGFRNAAFASVDLKKGFYSAQNVNGKASGQRMGH